VNAAYGYERCCRQTEAFSAQTGGNDDVPTIAEVPINLEGNPAAEPIENKSPMGLGNAELPGKPACLIPVQRLAPVPPS